MIRQPALLLVLSCVLAFAAEPTFADLPTEEFVLVDGRKMVGRYDEAHGLLWLVGPANARLGLRPSDIARRRELAPGERPTLANAPLPSGAKGDGASTVSPTIVRAAKRDEVTRLEHRERELKRLFNEQEQRRQHFVTTLAQLKEHYRDLHDALLNNPDPNFGIESHRSFRLRELHGEILRCAQLLRQSEDRVAALTISHDDAFFALSRGQSELAALDRGDADSANLARTPTLTAAPFDSAAWRIRELETKLDALQRDHERLKQTYEELRRRSSPPPTAGVQPSEDRRAAGNDIARLTPVPGG